jgi:hypothetical protein
MRRDRADNTVNIALSVDNNGLSRDKSAVDTAELIELDEALVSDARNDEADLIYMCIEKYMRRIFIGTSERADDIPM